MRLGVHYFPPHRQDSNAHFIRRAPLTGATEYYKNGQKFSAEYYKTQTPTIHPVPEEFDDLVISRYKNGKKLSQGYHKDGKEIGLWTHWFENGQKKWEGHYKDGKRDGFFITWYEDGKIRSKFYYKDGKLDGLWAEWYEDGE